MNPFADKLWLAPLTFGGNLPFRRLCVEFGAQVTVGEMAVVRKLLKGRNAEYALLRSHPSEPFFGAQLADRDEATLAEGARIAAGKGARFVDLNCGCPIFEFTRRGLGSGLLQRPRKIAGLVAAMKAAVDVPSPSSFVSGIAATSERGRDLTVVRRGRGVRDHDPGRTAKGAIRKPPTGRHRRSRGEARNPVVWNGDILGVEARDRKQRSGVTS